jgi:iron transport multicopper oxidase
MPFNSSRLFTDATASITYSPSANITDLSPVPSGFYQDTDDTSLVPIIPQAQFPPATQTIELEAQFYVMDDGTNRGTFNDLTFNYPKVPSTFTQVQYADEYISE